MTPYALLRAEESQRAPEPGMTRGAHYRALEEYMRHLSLRYILLTEQRVTREQIENIALEENQ